MIGTVASPLRILYVECDPGESAVLRHQLRMAGSFELGTTRSLREAAARAGEADVILLDVSDREGRGLECLCRLLEWAPLSRVVMVGGEANPAVAREALRRGARDYLVKGEFGPARLARAIRQAVERRDGAPAPPSPARGPRFDRSVAVVELRSMRRTLAELPPGPAAVVLIEVDRVEPLAAAQLERERVLEQMVRLIRGQLRACDCVARTGEDAVLVLLPQTNEQTAEFVAERLLASLEPLQLAVQLGVTSLEGSPDTVAELIRQARSAMRRSELRRQGGLSR